MPPTHGVTSRYKHRLLSSRRGDRLEVVQPGHCIRQVYKEDCDRSREKTARRGRASQSYSDDIYYGQHCQGVPRVRRHRTASVKLAQFSRYGMANFARSNSQRTRWSPTSGGPRYQGSDKFEDAKGWLSHPYLTVDAIMEFPGLAMLARDYATEYSQQFQRKVEQEEDFMNQVRTTYYDDDILVQNDLESYRVPAPVTTTILREPSTAFAILRSSLRFGADQVPHRVRGLPQHRVARNDNNRAGRSVCETSGL